MSEVLMYRQAVYAVNTKKSYCTHGRVYHRFCDILQIAPVPLGNNHLCMFAAYLARFLLPSSVCQYLNYVGLIHKENGYPNPLLDNWVFSSVIKGIKRIHGVAPKPKLPISIDILYLIHSRLNLSNSKHASFWAICLVSFFGLFRKSHLLPISHKDFDPAQFLLRSDFSFCKDVILVLVRWSKTIQLGQRTVTIPLVGIPDSCLCPLSAIRQAFFLTPSAQPMSQAFCYRDSSLCQNVTFTYKAFLGCLHHVLRELGIPISDYACHSFRRGGATYALEAGVPLDHIAVMGDWKSDAMYLYLHMPLRQRLQAQRTITSSLTNS